MNQPVLRSTLAPRSAGQSSAGRGVHVPEAAFHRPGPPLGIDELADAIRDPDAARRGGLVLEDAPGQVPGLPFIGPLRADRFLRLAVDQVLGHLHQPSQIDLHLAPGLFDSRSGSPMAHLVAEPGVDCFLSARLPGAEWWVSVHARLDGEHERVHVFLAVVADGQHDVVGVPIATEKKNNDLPCEPFSQRW